jgi:hypothetical protein
MSLSLFALGFAPGDTETATALAGSRLDGVAFETEHAPTAPAGTHHHRSRREASRQAVHPGLCVTVHAVTS